MPHKPRFLPMPRDEQVLDARNQAVQEWLEHARSDEACLKVREFLTGLQCKSGQPKQMHPAIKGGYNLAYRLEYEDGHSILMRIPIKDLVPFPEEKVIYEVSTMRYVAANTSIPVPHVYSHGTSSENPTGLGPYIVMDYIDHHTNMSRELLDPARRVESRPVLDPNVSKDKLELLYGEMAKILLQLYSLGPFSRIGSLVEDGLEGRHHGFASAPETAQKSSHGLECKWPKPSSGSPEIRARIMGRPLTVNMVDLATDTGAPHDFLPRTTRTFSSAKEWYKALGAMHMTQLLFQNGECVEDEDDARDKYVARKLFQGLVASERLFSPCDNNPRTDRRERLPDQDHADSPKFRLFSEDLRPANVLLDKDLKVVGVIDWEFVYSAPNEFSTDPPWWLLLTQPEDHPGGLFSWIGEYDKRLDVFLRALEREEQRSQEGESDKDGGSSGSPRSPKKSRQGRRDSETGAPPSEPLLSQQMNQSWESGRWMVNYAARKSWMFDLVWWRFLDEAYFGVNEDQDYKARVGRLTMQQREKMEEFVKQKAPTQNTVVASV